VPASNPGPVRPGNDELRKERATVGLRQRGGLGRGQGEHRPYHRQGAEEVRRHPVQIHGYDENVCGSVRKVPVVK